MKTAGRRAPTVVRGMRVGVLVVVSLGVGCWLALHANKWLESTILRSDKAFSVARHQEFTDERWSVSRYRTVTADSYTVSLKRGLLPQGANISEMRGSPISEVVPKAVDLDRTVFSGQAAHITVRGWPLRHSYSAYLINFSSTIVPPVPRDAGKPWAGVLWDGLLVDTALFTLPVIGAAALMRWASLALKRRRRVRTWRCVQCGYDLRGLSGEVCPECGAGNPMCGDAT